MMNLFPQDGAPTVRRLYVARMTRPGASTQRYRVWELAEGQLVKLWPADSHMRTRAALLPFQRFSLSEGYDAFHFVFARGVFANHAIGAALAKLWKIDVSVIDLVDQVQPLAFDRTGAELRVIP